MAGMKAFMAEIQAKASAKAQKNKGGDAAPPGNSFMAELQAKAQKKKGGAAAPPVNRRASAPPNLADLQSQLKSARKKTGDAEASLARAGPFTPRRRLVFFLRADARARAQARRS